MGSKYQQISSYTGTLYGNPEHAGLEYDWEVPDTTIVGSPGGTSSVHHHPTKGFYGRGNTSRDIFAGQGQAYLSGAFGNLYETGHDAFQRMETHVDAPDYQYWQNQEPSQYSYTHQPGSTWLPGKSQIPPDYPEKEKFEMGYDSSFELIDSDSKKSSDIESFEGTDVQVKSKLSPWVALLILLFIFIVLYLWSKTGDRFMIQYINKGRKPTWQQLLFYALVASVVLIAILYFIGFSETSLYF